MKMSDSLIVSSRSLFCCCEETKMSPYPTSIYLCCPFSGSPVPIDTLKTTLVIFVHSAVAHVLCVGGFSEVQATVIKGVVIAMICFLSWFATKDKTLHLNVFFFPTIWLSGSIVALCASAPHGTPVPLIQPVEVTGINNSILSLRKWNKAVGFIVWLGYCVTLHAVFSSHRSTSNGSLQLSHNFIT